MTTTLSPFSSPCDVFDNAFQEEAAAAPTDLEPSLRTLQTPPPTGYYLQRRNGPSPPSPPRSAPTGEKPSFQLLKSLLERGISVARNPGPIPGATAGVSPPDSKRGRQSPTSGDEEGFAKMVADMRRPSPALEVTKLEGRGATLELLKQAKTTPAEVPTAPKAPEVVGRHMGLPRVIQREQSVPSPRSARSPACPSPSVPADQANSHHADDSLSAHGPTGQLTDDALSGHGQDGQHTDDALGGQIHQHADNALGGHSHLHLLTDSSFRGQFGGQSGVHSDEMKQEDDDSQLEDETYAAYNLKLAMGPVDSLLRAKDDAPWMKASGRTFHIE